MTAHVPGTGPTGRFPRGLLGRTDEGELAIAIAVTKDGTIVMDFGEKGAHWIGMGPDEADALADVLRAKAKEARGT